MRDIINYFITDLIENHPNRITNEFNVQFYLGVHLLNIGCSNVEIEHKLDNENWMDIIWKYKNTNYGIEIKCPLLSSSDTLNPMRETIDNIRRLESVVRNGKIDVGLFFMLSNNHNFWEGGQVNQENTNLYNCFRGNNMSVVIPEGKEYNLSSSYSTAWKGNNSYKYFLVCVSESSALK